MTFSALKWTKIGAAAALVLVGAGSAQSQTAAPSNVFEGLQNGRTVSISMSLKARVGPFELARGTMEVSLDRDSYQASTTYRTSGLGASISTGAGSANVRGNVVNNTLRPVTYTSQSNTGSRRRTTISYSGGNPNATTSPAFDDLGHPPATDGQKRNTLDPITGLIELSLMTGRDNGQPCGGTVQIFDGKRRYDISTRFVRRERTTTPAFTGQAIVCQATYTEIAGFKAKPADERAPIRMTMWLADVGNNGATIPIRMRGGRGGINVTLYADRATVR